LPAAACIFAVAPFLVPTLLGQKWLDAVPLMQILAFNGALMLFHSSICAVLIGRGFPARVTYSNACYTAILLLLLALFFLFWRGLGVEGAAYAALLTSVLCTPIYLYQMRHCLGLGPSLFLKAIARPMIAAGVLVVLVRAVLPAYDPAMGGVVVLGWLVAGIALAVASYLATVAAVWQLRGRPPGAEQVLLGRVGALWTRRFATAGDRS